MLQVPKLTGAMGGKRGATHKPCKNQGTNTDSQQICMAAAAQTSSAGPLGFALIVCSVLVDLECHWRLTIGYVPVVSPELGHLQMPRRHGPPIGP